jgi:lipopolysaccharide/colanic/teichoic acid biosynthesis glycosyltransferase
VATDLSSMHVRLLLSEEGKSNAVWELPDPVFLPYADAPWESRRYRYAKRAVDVLGASVMLALGAIPSLAIAAAIRMTSEGPIFYREERIGRNGQPFRIWKFRSMRPKSSRSDVTTSLEDSDDHWRFSKGSIGPVDPRITPIGNFLRKWSLDELPQILNVLRGDMSLVGPRPVVEAETNLYRDLLPFYLAAKPGLSGLWQVSGRSKLDFEKRARLDAFYVQTWSLKTDLYILWRTWSAVLSRSGAC